MFIQGITACDFEEKCLQKSNQAQALLGCISDWKGTCYMYNFSSSSCLKSGSSKQCSKILKYHFFSNNSAPPERLFIFVFYYMKDCYPTYTTYSTVVLMGANHRHPANQ